MSRDYKFGVFKIKIVDVLGKDAKECLRVIGKDAYAHFPTDKNLICVHSADIDNNGGSQNFHSYLLKRKDVKYVRIGR
jgi:hypothetical protein